MAQSSFADDPIAIWVGLISYPLYLWHWPILSFLHIIDNNSPNLTNRLGAVVFSIILAWLTIFLLNGQ